MFVQGDGGRPLKGCHWCSAEFLVIVAMTRSWILNYIFSEKKASSDAATCIYWYCMHLVEDIFGVNFFFGAKIRFRPYTIIQLIRGLEIFFSWPKAGGGGSTFSVSLKEKKLFGFWRLSIANSYKIFEKILLGNLYFSTCTATRVAWHQRSPPLSPDLPSSQVEPRRPIPVERIFEQKKIVSSRRFNSI